MSGFAVYDFSCGPLRMVYEDDALIGLEKADTAVDAGVRTDLTELAAAQLAAYFSGKRQYFTVPYRFTKGTVFQRQVWDALCEIPYGQTRSYQDIAVRIGRPKAVRAVGMANHMNPLAILVPCHRVIGKNGGLTGYGGGLAMKKFLLDLERKYR